MIVVFLISVSSSDANTVYFPWLKHIGTWVPSASISRGSEWYPEAWPSPRSSFEGQVRGLYVYIGLSMRRAELQNILFNWCIKTTNQNLDGWLKSGHIMRGEKNKNPKTLPRVTIKMTCTRVSDATDCMPWLFHWHEPTSLCLLMEKLFP